MPSHTASFWLSLLLTALLAGQTGCSQNAATGRRQLVIMSAEQEKQLGLEAAPQFTAEFGGAVEDAQLQAYVTEIGSALARQVEGEYSGIEWSFTLLDSSVVNAFALPGGRVFITRGLCASLTSEAQLAGVLGHEVGHVTARHANERISSQQLFSGGVMVVDAVLASGAGGDDARGAGTVLVPALAIGGQLVFLKFGRAEELEADMLGMRYMSRAGWDPRGQREVMEVLAALSSERDLEWLATHPHPETRIKEIDQRLASEYRNRDGYRTNAPVYRSRMLDRLSRLPAPKHGGEAAAGAMRLSWCGCAGCHGYAGRSD